jgi:hypothetical protein
MSKRGAKAVKTDWETERCRKEKEEKGGRR